MAMVDLVMPKMGESIMEATILKWHKQPGDPVQMDETMLEIATDKVDSEVPSTAEGTVKEILFQENDVVPVGTVIARIETSAQGGGSAPQQSAPAAETPQAPAAPSSVPAAAAPTSTPSPSPAAASSATGGPRFYSPLVL